MDKLTTTTTAKLSQENLDKTFKTLELLYAIEPSTHIVIYDTIYDWIRTHFSFLSPDDLLEAFSLAASGTILTDKGKVINLECYGKPISITYLGNVLVPYKAYRRKRNKSTQIQAAKEQKQLGPRQIDKAETLKAIKNSISEYIKAAAAGKDFRVAFFHYDYINDHHYKFTDEDWTRAKELIIPRESQRIILGNERRSQGTRMSYERLRAAIANLPKSKEAELEVKRYLVKQWIIKQSKKSTK